MYVYGDSFTMLQHVFETSVINTQACFESCAPIINGCVDDPLFNAELSV